MTQQTDEQMIAELRVLYDIVPEFSMTHPDDAIGEYMRLLIRNAPALLRLAEQGLRMSELEATHTKTIYLLAEIGNIANAIRARDGAPEGYSHDYFYELVERIKCACGGDILRKCWEANANLKDAPTDIREAAKGVWPYLLEYDRLLKQQRTVSPDFVKAIEALSKALSETDHEG